jgi:hypothetical protein
VYEDDDVAHHPLVIIAAATRCGVEPGRTKLKPFDDSATAWGCKGPTHCKVLSQELSTPACVDD